MSLDHVVISTRDYDVSRAFYEKALAPLGIVLVMKLPPEFGAGAGFGPKGKPEFWIDAAKPPTDRVHVAFRAKSRAEVQAFYDAAMAAGGTDNGPPGVRAHYHQDYYGAFVRDPDGHNIEAVCHESYL